MKKSNISKYMSSLGKKSAGKFTKEEKSMRGRNAAFKRWNKNND